jgi:aminopeptidase N
MSIVYLQDYQPSNYLIKRVYLEIKLDEEATQVRSEIEFYHNTGHGLNSDNQLVLHGEGLTLQDITLDRQQLEPNAYEVTDSALIIKNPPAHFTLYVTNLINPKTNTSLNGLYFASKIFCTQCEPEGFRKITYYLDRPDILAVFTTKIIASKISCPVLLSNGNLVDKGDVNDKLHYAVWHDPFKKPSYLFALVAGNLIAVEDHFQTKSNRLITLKIYVEHENLDQTSHSMLALKKAMLWDEENYGREYDLDIYMIVAVNDFNMGAMENKGLNIFNSKYVLGRPETATDDDFVGIDLVIGHEYFHNWSGNRVTCRDWFQLSLKEGFTVYREQQFTSYVTQSKVGRIKDVRTLRNSQFLEDAGPLAHSVQPSSYQQINNFYTATIYSKGAELIGMQKTILGDKAYRKATDHYFNKFDGQAVTIDDFVNVLSESSGIDLRQFKRWYQQPGTPQVTIIQEFVNDKLIIKLRQHNPKSPDGEPLLIPLNTRFMDRDGKKLYEAILMLREFEQEFVFGPFASKPIIALNRGFSAPIQLHFEQDLAEKYILIAHETDSYTQWNSIQEIYLKAIKNIIVDKVELARPELIAVLTKFLLSPHNDNALKAMCIAMPTFNEVLTTMPEVDPLEVVAAMDKLQNYLACNLEEILWQLFTSCNTVQKYAYTPSRVADRLLKGSILYILINAYPTKYLNPVIKLFDEADNMTDTYWALKCLNHINTPERTEYFAKFYHKWSENKLIVNKWLGLQAASKLPNTLEVVKELLNHKSFNLANPNNVYALINGFCEQNPLNFHALDFSGYKFLTQIVTKLNTINPQVAATVLTPFSKFKKYDQIRAQAIVNELRLLSAIDHLSSDVQEIVNKSLDDYA